MELFAPEFNVQIVKDVYNNGWFKYRKYVMVFSDMLSMKEIKISSAAASRSTREMHFLP